jgi:hypothetical protein
MRTPWKIQIEWQGETKILYGHIQQLMRNGRNERIALSDGTEWPMENVVKINDIAF